MKLMPSIIKAGNENEEKSDNKSLSWPLAGNENEETVMTLMPPIIIMAIKAGNENEETVMMPPSLINIMAIIWEQVRV